LTAIIDRAADTLYGDCAVRVLTAQPETAEIVVRLARSSQGKGVATEALTAVIEALFERRDMHRVCAETDDRNLAVARLFERLGLRCEARLVEADWFNGEWSTPRIYAMLNREWHDRRRG
jgi:RimJ/RimL family protein N-acetyltransferase